MPVHLDYSAVSDPVGDITFPTGHRCPIQAMTGEAWSIWGNAKEAPTSEDRAAAMHRLLDLIVPEATPLDVASLPADGAFRLLEAASRGAFVVLDALKNGAGDGASSPSA